MLSGIRRRLNAFLALIAFGLAIASLPGCASPVPPLPSQLQKEHTIRVNGLDRTYRLFVPPNSGSSPMPVVFAFHGGGMTGESMAEWTGIYQIAAREGFMVVYPDGTRTMGLFGSWNVGSASPQVPAEEKGIDDVAFVRTLVETLKGEYEIDPHRIYAVGVSLGGMLSYHLACNMSQTFAAIAVVAGGMTTANCTPVSPVAVLVLHGLDDQFVPLSGGRGKHTQENRSWPSIYRGLEFWSQKNGCEKKPEEILKGTGATCWAYSPCSTNRPVEYCTVEGGHQWPGQPAPMAWQKVTGERISPFPASERIWAFFKANPRPA